MALPTFEIALLVQGALFGVFAAFVLWYRSLPSPLEDDSETTWLDAGEALARDVRDCVDEYDHAVDSASTSTVERVRRSFLLLSTRLEQHERLAPSAIDDGLLLRVHSLATRCRYFGLERPPARYFWDGRSLPEELAALGAAARELEVDLSTARQRAGRMGVQ